jgi:hypothetical protein
MLQAARAHPPEAGQVRIVLPVVDTTLIKGSIVSEIALSDRAADQKPKLKERSSAVGA